MLKFAENLLSVSDKVYHYRRPPNCAPPFIVWAEDAEDGSFHANNRKDEQRVHGTVDLFTQTEFDPLADWIQDTLYNLDGCGWTLQAVQFEEETNLIHLTWQWWW